MANTTTNPKNENRPVTDKAKDVASQVVDKARDAASTVGGMVSSAASTVGHTADNLASSAGSGMKSLGETIGQHTPREGMLGTASQAVANTLKSGGKYLEQEGLSGMMDDATELIRRNPIPAVLIGIGIGFLIGRTLGS